MPTRGWCSTSDTWLRWPRLSPSLSAEGALQLQAARPPGCLPGSRHFKGSREQLGRAIPPPSAPPLLLECLKHLLPNCCICSRRQAFHYGPAGRRAQGGLCVLWGAGEAGGWLLWLHLGVLHHLGSDVLVRLVFQKKKTVYKKKINIEGEKKTCIEARDGHREEGQKCGNSLPQLISLLAQMN